MCSNFGYVWLIFSFNCSIVLCDSSISSSMAFHSFTSKSFSAFRLSKEPDRTFPSSCKFKISVANSILFVFRAWSSSLSAWLAFSSSSSSRWSSLLSRPSSSLFFWSSLISSERRLLSSINCFVLLSNVCPCFSTSVIRFSISVKSVLQETRQANTNTINANLFISNYNNLPDQKQ